MLVKSFLVFNMISAIQGCNVHIRKKDHYVLYEYINIFFQEKVLNYVMLTL